MKKLLDFCQFIDDNKKMYVNANTGKGKTLLASILALFFLETHPNFKVISNYTLNIYSKQTNECLCEYSRFGLLPFSKLRKGNYLVIIDDFKAVKQHLSNFGSILAILSRKLNVHVFITLHYYTHLIKENREMFNQEITLDLSHLQYSFENHRTELTEKSGLIAYFYDTNSLELTKTERFKNVLKFVEGNFALENVYVEGCLYDTYQVVEFPNKPDIIKDISKWSKNLKDLEQNVRLFTGKEKEQLKIIREISLQKGF